MSTWHNWLPAGRMGGHGRRIAAVPHPAAVAGALLGLAAVTEALARGVDTGTGALSLVAVSALALFTTVPLAFLGPAAAAVTIAAANVLSLAVFHQLTVAGLSRRSSSFISWGAGDRESIARGPSTTPGAWPGGAVRGDRSGRGPFGGF